MFAWVLYVFKILKSGCHYQWYHLTTHYNRTRLPVDTTRVHGTDAIILWIMTCSMLLIGNPHSGSMHVDAILEVLWTAAWARRSPFKAYQHGTAVRWSVEKFLGIQFKHSLYVSVSQDLQFGLRSGAGLARGQMLFSIWMFFVQMHISWNKVVFYWFKVKLHIQ